MMLDATPQNIEWLILKLYHAKRFVLSTDTFTQPVFVLLTKGQDDRHKVEDLFYRHFMKKYGTGVVGMDKTFKAASPMGTTEGMTRIELGEIGASILLIDL